MSRPTKLTNEKIERIGMLIRAGHYFKTAAQACGISETRFYDMKAKGAKASSGIYRRLYDECKQAEADSELILLDRVLAGGPKGALEVLKRRFPERWGDRHRLEHSGPNGGPLRQEHSGTIDGPDVTVIIAGTDSTWNEAVFGAIQDATEDDLPDAEP